MRKVSFHKVASLATRLSYDGIFNDHSVTQSLLNLLVKKKLKYRSIFGKVLGKSSVLFFASQGHRGHELIGQISVQRQNYPADNAMQGASDPWAQTHCLKIIFKLETTASFCFFLWINTPQILWAPVHFKVQKTIEEDISSQGSGSPSHTVFCSG